MSSPLLASAKCAVKTRTTRSISAKHKSSVDEAVAILRQIATDSPPSPPIVEVPPPRRLPPTRSAPKGVKGRRYDAFETLRQILTDRSKAEDLKISALESVEEEVHSATVGTSESGKKSWKEEKWESGWGEDKLASPRSLRRPRDRPNQHIVTPLPYTRRVEGLLSTNLVPVLQDVTSPSEHLPIATLAHGLDRVLFNPGVHWLQDPRSKVYNFTPWLETIPQVKDYAFERFPGFTRSSCDEDLWELAKREKRTFSSSTSSLTSILSHIYFLISGDKMVDTSVLSSHFKHEPRTFTPGQRMPASVVFNHRDGLFAIDAGSSEVSKSEKNVLTFMGTMLERFLTTPQDVFKSYMRSAPVAEDVEDDPRREAFRFAKSSRFVMRSQLDCQDSRLPGTGVFDIKTRAALPIRLDLLNYEENSGYLIRTTHGLLESFEKEYYDLIRSAFLKYSFQARIGNMDGVLVAYHNTARMFGFQYISLDEMDERLYGEKGCGEVVFEKCIGMLEAVSDEIIQIFPGQSTRCTFETLEDSGVMKVWVEPEPVNGIAPGMFAGQSSSSDVPVAQLDVTAKSFFGKAEVHGSQAVSSSNADWTVHWTISKSSLSEDEIRQNLAACRDRQFRAYNLPTGVNLGEMEERWHALNFGGKEGTRKVPFNPEQFVRPRQKIKHLRMLARVGKEEMAKLAAEDEGRAKVVWGPEMQWAKDGDANMLDVLGESSEANESLLDGEAVATPIELISNEDLMECENAEDTAVEALSASSQSLVDVTTPDAMAADESREQELVELGDANHVTVDGRERSSLDCWALLGDFARDQASANLLALKDMHKDITELDGASTLSDEMALDEPILVTAIEHLPDPERVEQEDPREATDALIPRDDGATGAEVIVPQTVVAVSQGKEEAEGEASTERPDNL